jgi:hypothetical protein
MVIAGLCATSSCRALIGGIAQADITCPPPSPPLTAAELERPVWAVHYTESPAIPIYRVTTDPTSDWYELYSREAVGATLDGWNTLRRQLDEFERLTGKNGTIARLKITVTFPSVALAEAEVLDNLMSAGQGAWLSTRHDQDLADLMSGLPPLERVNAHSSEINSVAFSPDGARIATVGGDFALRVWDATSDLTSPLLERFNAHSYIDSVAFSPDGARIATVGNDNALRVWDTASDLTSPLLERVNAHSGGITSVAFSPHDVGKPAVQAR